MTTTLERTVPARAAEPERPHIVCLCGSLRFTAELARENARLTAQGHFVLAPAAVGLDRPSPLWATPDAVTALKERLGRVHRAKIEFAHEVVVVCPDGYIGDDTLKEIAHAKSLGKPITYRDTRAPAGTVRPPRPEPASSAPVFAADFVQALREVRPHCGEDVTLELTRGIRLQARGDRLYVVASGLYTLGATVIDTPGIGTWDAHVPRTAVDALTTLATTDDAYLEHVPAETDRDGTSALVVHLGAQQYTVEHHYIGDYPNWQPLVAEAIAAGPALDREVVLYANQLAKFTLDEFLPLVMWGGSDPAQPLAVTRGTHHVGLIKPQRRVYAPGPDEIRDAWRHILTDTGTAR
ncbi:hypothetical protein ACIRL2_45890 [Embleya sp. NPDC127516]|uniref:hypothetical protein n=1 Tax=Embleya sp. NPDC127516 TaxID=3363990 RepID=UPI003811B035